MKKTSEVKNAENVNGYIAERCYYKTKMIVVDIIASFCITYFPAHMYGFNYASRLNAKKCLYSGYCTPRKKERVLQVAAVSNSSPIGFLYTPTIRLCGKSNKL